MSKKNKPIDRPVPPNYKKFFELQFFHKPTWPERLQILFGYRVRMRVKVASECSPGSLHSVMRFSTTTDLQPKENQT